MLSDCEDRTRHVRQSTVFRTKHRLMGIPTAMIPINAEYRRDKDTGDQRTQGRSYGPIVGIVLLQESKNKLLRTSMIPHTTKSLFFMICLQQVYRYNTGSCYLYISNRHYCRLRALNITTNHHRSSIIVASSLHLSQGRSRYHSNIIKDTRQQASKETKQIYITLLRAR